MIQSLREVVREFAEKYKTPRTGFESQIAAWQKAIGPYYPGEMTVIGARPGVGKTSLILTEAAAMSVRTKADGSPIKQLFCSFEQPSYSVGMTAMCLMMQFPTFTEMRKQEVHPEQIAEFAEWSGFDTPLYFMFEPATTDEVECQAGELGVDIVWVDYMQICRSGESQDAAEQRISQISGGFTRLAKVLDIPVVVLAQLNRRAVDPKTGQEPEPTSADLKYSDKIFADAATLVLLHRPDRNNPICKVICVKNRFGEVPEPFDIELDGAIRRFGDVGHTKRRIERQKEEF